MNTGIGDAVNLSWKLAAVVKGEARERLLDSYELERIGFARRLVATTDRVFTFITRNGPIARLVRTRLVPFVLPLLFRLHPVRRLLFRTVSQIGLDYHTSPLSAGRAGRLRGGDRLPWAGTEGRTDNFSALRSLAWQVHVYGLPPDGLAEACSELHLPIHLFEWRSEMSRTGLRRAAVYLIRPDGYIALIDGNGAADGLRRYFNDAGSMMGRR
jgi:hypothetical protein